MSRVNVSNERTASGVRSGGTATNSSSAPTSIPAASGFSTGSMRAPPLPLLFLLLLCATLRLLLPEPAARGYETSKLLNGITAEADVTTDLYVTSDPRLSTGLSEHQCRVRTVAAAGTSRTIV